MSLSFKKKSIYGFLILACFFVFLFVIKNNELTNKIELELPVLSFKEILTESETIQVDTQIEQTKTAETEKNKVAVDPYLREFHKTNDLHKFVNDNIEDAVNGDSRAQYFIFQALRECEGWSKHPAFKSPELLEQHLIKVKAYGNFTEKSYRQSFELCKDFVGEDMLNKYGKADDWLEKSHEAQYPPAVIEVLQNEMLYFSSFNEKKLLEKKLTISDINATRNNLITKSLSVLKLGDPQSLFNSANSLIEFPDYSFEVSTTAWMLLACKQGMPCSGDNRWLKSICSYGHCFNSDSIRQMTYSEASTAVVNEADELILKLELAITSGDWRQLSPRYKKFETN